MAITQLMIGLAPWNYFHLIENKILVKIMPKRDTRLQRKTMIKIPAFFSIFFT